MSILLYSYMFLYVFMYVSIWVYVDLLICLYGEPNRSPLIYIPVSLSYSLYVSLIVPQYVLMGLLYAFPYVFPYIVIYGIADIINGTPATSLTYKIPSLSYSNHHPIQSYKHKERPVRTFYIIMATAGIAGQAAFRHLAKIRDHNFLPPARPLFYFHINFLTCAMFLLYGLGVFEI